MKTLAGALPAGPQAGGRVRHDALRRGVDPRGDDHAGRGDAARLPRGVPVPAELARDADPVRRGAGVAASAPSPGLLPLGYSINTLTLFGMVLAIGIVVDDAIVVLENVERIMHEEHVDAREAAIKAMQRGDEPDRRHRARAVRGVHPDRVPRRPHGRALPPVRGDHLDRRGALRHRGAHAHARAHGDASSSASTRQPGRFFQCVQPLPSRAPPTATRTAWPGWCAAAPIASRPLRRHGGDRGGPVARSRRARSFPRRTRASTSPIVLLPDGSSLERTDEMVQKVVASGEGEPERSRTRSRSRVSTSSAAAPSATTRRPSSSP